MNHTHLPRRRVLLAAWLATASLGAQAALFGASDAAPAPVVLKPDSVPADVFKHMIDDGAALRHVSKAYSGASKTVAIGTVRLNFVTDSSDTATTRQFMGKATVSQSVNLKLQGVDIDTMQALADGFHAALRRQLTAQGYEVVEQTKLLENADYQQAVAGTKGVAVSGGVTSVYAQGTGAVAGFAMRNFAFNLKLPVVLADLTLNFAAFEKDTDRWAAGGYEISASVKSKMVSSVSGQMRLMTEDGGGANFDIVRPLALPGAIAERVEPIQKSGAEVAGTAALGVLSALMGSKAESASSSFLVVAAKDYREVMTADLARVAAVVASVLQKRP